MKSLSFSRATTSCFVKTLSKTLPDLLQPLLEQSIEMRKIAKEINPDYKKVGFNKLGGN